MRESTEAALRDRAARAQSVGRVPGLSAGVVRRGTLAWHAGIGTADLAVADVAPDADTQYLIASNSKTFTAVVVMALRDEGRLRLDDTLDVHIPECGHTGLTIRTMLSHHSGMQREPVTDVWETLEQPDRQELVSGFAEAEQVLAPRHRFHYSNLVYSMLGEVIARIDGREWFDSVKARILDPLGMSRTTQGLSGRTAQGYYLTPFSDVPVLEPTFDFKAMAACGGLASTAADLAAWSGFVADPVSEVLSPDTFEEMLQPQVMVDLDRWTSAFGLGFMLVRRGDHVFVGHTGGMPGHITGVFTHRPSGVGGLALMNTTSAPDPAALATDLARAVIEREPEAKVWRPGTHVPADLASILGRWYSEGEPFDFSVRNGRLEARHPDLPTHKAPAVFERIDDSTYRTVSGREEGELLRVVRRPDGSVERMAWATYVVTRAPLAFGEWLTD